MLNDTLTGLYGKLPAHGDFIQRNLPTDFINAWDEWMQHFISASQEQMGEDWLNIYLTSPIWRFVFSPGVIDVNTWAGIMIPSVDKVGRYFPFSVVAKLPAGSNPMQCIAMEDEWFSQIEGLALEALDGQTQVDDLIQSIQAIELKCHDDYQMTGIIPEANLMMMEMFEEQDPSVVYSYFLDSIMQKTYSSYSAWSTQGSERVSPCVFATQGLPPINGISAMMDGQWVERNWQQPYRLKI